MKGSGKFQWFKNKKDKYKVLEDSKDSGDSKDSKEFDDDYSNYEASHEPSEEKKKIYQKKKMILLKLLKLQIRNKYFNTFLSVKILYNLKPC